MEPSDATPERDPDPAETLKDLQAALVVIAQLREEIEYLKPYRFKARLWASVLLKLEQQLGTVTLLKHLPADTLWPGGNDIR